LIFQRINNYWRNCKSIILGALGLVLGKSRFNLLKNKEDKCVIEVHFEISKYNLKSFEANDLDYEDDTIIRGKFFLQESQELYQ
jgi:DNA repair ATPase RecN